MLFVLFGSSLPPEDGHLDGEVKDLSLAECLLHFLLHFTIDLGIDIANFSQGF